MFGDRIFAWYPDLIDPAGDLAFAPSAMSIDAVSRSIVGGTVGAGKATIGVLLRISASCTARANATASPSPSMCM